MFVIAGLTNRAELLNTLFSDNFCLISPIAATIVALAKAVAYAQSLLPATTPADANEITNCSNTSACP